MYSKERWSFRYYVPWHGIQKTLRQSMLLQRLRLSVKPALAQILQPLFPPTL